MTKTLFLLAVLSLAINCSVINAIALYCRFEIITPEAVQMYACSASVLNDTRSLEQLTGVFGTHLPGKGNDDVRALIVNSATLQFFPTNIVDFLPNIEFIDFSNNTIPSVTNGNLIAFPNLWYLNLAGNRISLLNSNLFSGLTSLKLIILSVNGITSIDSNLFAGIKSGSFIDLSNNTIRHVGHDLILPSDSNIWIMNNICVDNSFYTYSDDIVEEIRFELLTKCPPTISLIESTLESRPNFIQNLINRVRILEELIENGKGNGKEVNGNDTF